MSIDRLNHHSGFFVLIPLLFGAFLLVSCGSTGSRMDIDGDLTAAPSYVYESQIAGNIGSRPLSKPTTVSVDALGNLIILDGGNNRIVKTSQSGEYLAEMGGFGFQREQFNAPVSFATADGINLYVLDSHNNRIVRLDADLHWLSEKRLSELSLDIPVGRAVALAINSFGDFYISDPDNSRVLRFDANYTYVSTLGDLGAFVRPGAIAIDSRDGVLVVDDERKRIFYFDSYDNYVTVIAKDLFGQVKSLGTDSRGRIYLSDTKDNLIRILSPNGDQIGSFGNVGSQRYQLRRVSSVCVSGNHLYVSDFDADRVVVYRRIE